MSGKKRQPGRKDEAWQQRKQLALDEAPAFLARCVLAGLDLKVSEVTRGKTRFPHWRFTLPDGFAVLHYWPTAGTYRTADNVKGAVQSSEAAFLLALELANCEYSVEVPVPDHDEECCEPA